MATKLATALEASLAATSAPKGLVGEIERVLEDNDITRDQFATMDTNDIKALFPFVTRPWITAALLQFLHANAIGDDFKETRVEFPRITAFGNIGVGKSTVTTRLANFLGFLLRPEHADNPHLTEFYRALDTGSDENLSAITLKTQLWFLEKCDADRNTKKPVVCDRDKLDNKLFGEVLRGQGILTEADYEECMRQYNAHTVPLSDLYILLQTSKVEILEERIRARGRENEARITNDYLRRLEDAHQEQIKYVSQSRPVVIVPWDEFHLVEDVWAQICRLDPKAPGVYRVDWTKK